MKYYLFLIIFLTISCHKPLITSTATDKKSNSDKAYQLKVKNINGIFKYPNGPEHPNDSIVYKNVLAWGKSKECSSLLSFAKTTVEMLGLNEKHTDYKLNKYRSCEAVSYGDTIEVTFSYSPFRSGDILYFESIPITILVNNDKFKMNIIHETDQVSMVKVNGKYEQVPFPKSEIEYARLTLNKRNYEIGDTIKGSLYARSIFVDKKYRMNVKKKKVEEFEEIKNEIIKGQFRVILEDRKDRCFQ